MNSRIAAALARVATLPELRVGVTQADGRTPKEQRDGGVGPVANLAQVAGAHEFGIDVRERSFLRATSKAHGRELLRLYGQALVAEIEGDTDADRRIARAGLAATTAVRDRIDARIPPPNAPATRAAKESDVPLIDTGQLKGSIRAEERRPNRPSRIVG